MQKLGVSIFHILILNVHYENSENVSYIYIQSEKLT